MMKEFKLHYTKKTFVRWENRKEFTDSIEKINYGKKNKIILFFLTYNLSDSVIKLLDILDSDRARNEFDILIIDNHSNNEHTKKIKEHILKKNIKNIICIYTSDNLGGAGGNAIGLEYILSENYESCIFTEDDAIPLGKDIVYHMYNDVKYSNKNIIKTIRNDLDGESGTFHFTLYPTEFIKLTGIPNPALFMRADDEDLHRRIEKIKHDHSYKSIIINQNYTHPIIKKGGGKYRGTYFALRNAFFVKMKSFRYINFKAKIKDLFREFIILFLYIRTGLLKLCIEYNANLLKTVELAIYDFLANNMDYKYNSLRMKHLITRGNDVKNISVEYKYEDLNDIIKDTKNYYIADPMLNIQKVCNFESGKNFINILKYGVLLCSFNLPTYPLIFIAKKAVSIEEFFIEEGKVYIGTTEDSRNLKNIVLFIITCLISFIIFIPVGILILLKIILFKIIRLLGK